MLGTRTEWVLSSWSVCSLGHAKAACQALIDLKETEPILSEWAKIVSRPSQCSCQLNDIEE